MIIGFFDESYYQDSFWFGSVLVGPAELPKLLEDLKLAKAESPAEHSYQELHGSEIFAGKGPWASSPIEERKFWYSRFLDCIATSGARVVAKGVGLPTHAAREVVAFRYLVEEVDRFAAKRGQPAVLLGDESQHKLHFALRRELRDAQTSGTGGYKPRLVQHVMDTPFFGPSTPSLGLQAADLVAFLVRRHDWDRRRSGSPAAQASLELWPHLQPIIAHKRKWTPKTR